MLLKHPHIVWHHLIVSCVLSRRDSCYNFPYNAHCVVDVEEEGDEAEKNGEHETLHDVVLVCSQNRINARCSLLFSIRSRLYFSFLYFVFGKFHRNLWQHRSSSRSQSTTQNSSDMFSQIHAPFSRCNDDEPP